MSSSITRCGPQPQQNGHGPVSSNNNAGKTVLGCWKEIADHLGKGVRTVQRWERECGLPVRRLNATFKGRVVAFTAELDEWLRQAPTRSDGSALDVTLAKHSTDASTPQPADFKPLILSVDDDLNVLFVREHLLKSEGYKVVSAAHGREALAIFSSQEIAVVLLDFQMPGMNGVAVGRRMKAEKPHVPIIMVSGNTLPDDVYEYVETVVVKGEHPSVLLSTVNSALQGQTSLPIRPAKAASDKGQRSKSTA